MKNSRLLLIASAMVLTLSAPAAFCEGAGEHPGNEKGKKEAHSHRQHADRSAEGRAFGKQEEKTIRTWFSNGDNLSALPPGLAKREQLPPGLLRQMKKGGTLPPGLESHVHALPQGLAGQLPSPPDGTRRVVVSDRIVLVEEASNKVLDVLKGVVPRDSKKRSRTTRGGKVQTRGVTASMSSSPVLIR